MSTQRPRHQGAVVTLLLEVLELMRPRLHELLPESQQHLCENFFERVTAAVEQLQVSG